MTQSTEQERASLSAFIEMAEREGFDTAHQWYDAKGWVFFSPSTADCWRYWQAARRAPAVPVPQGALHEAAQAVVERWDSPQWKEVPGTASYIADLRAALAAAPQPPEADHIEQPLEMVTAPVQLPEPVGVMALWPFDPRRDYIEWANESPARGTALYTEQQVRQLLADHGIEVAQ